MAGAGRLELRDLVPRTRGAALRVVAALAVGAVAGLLLAPPGPPRIEPDLAPPAVRLGGAPLALDGTSDDVLDRARAVARATTDAPIVIVVPEHGEVVRSRAELGLSVPVARLRALADALKSTASPLRRRTKGQGALDVPLPLELDATKLLAAVLDARDQVDRPPVDARLDFATHRVTPDEAGRRVDVHATLDRLERAVLEGAPRVEVVVTSPRSERTAERMRDVSTDDVLGYFETKYANDALHEARSFNLRLAASKLDGYVLLPGETFDFNLVVGARDEAHGYKVAPVITSGELVDGIGGGTCQVAGTLHGAALFAGLDVLERRPHTRPSYYIKMGLDAAVAYPTITLKLRNRFDHAVVLHETVSGGTVRAEILGPKRTREVTFVRRIDEVVAFKEREIRDKNVPAGQKVLVQRGIPGFRVTRLRVVREGSFAWRERTQDAYPATSQIWRVGTGDDDEEFVPKDDGHAEYVADERLVMVQGPEVKSYRAPNPGKGGDTVEQRVVGKYGTYGWTVKEGMASATHGTGKDAEKTAVGADDRPGVD